MFMDLLPSARLFFRVWVALVKADKNSAVMESAPQSRRENCPSQICVLIFHLTFLRENIVGKGRKRNIHN
jgi:hypothetical protein